MKKILSKAWSATKNAVKHVGVRTKCLALTGVAMALKPVGALAQSLANTGYDAGTAAMEDVATEIAKYVPYVVNLCYALAGVVAIVGAISVYIAMNNEEQDVKNILSHDLSLPFKRKDMQTKCLISVFYVNILIF